MKIVRCALIATSRSITSRKVMAVTARRTSLTLVVAASAMEITISRLMVRIVSARADSISTMANAGLAWRVARIVPATLRAQIVFLRKYRWRGKAYVALLMNMLMATNASNALSSA